MSLERVAEISRAIGCEVVENARMEAFTSFRIGGPADLLITAKTPIWCGASGRLAPNSICRCFL